jgi:hypothetical protein
MCHGARKLSQADTPNLAGKYPITIYKELVDFKIGHTDITLVGTVGR